MDSERAKAKGEAAVNDAMWMGKTVRAALDQTRSYGPRAKSFHN